MESLMRIGHNPLDHQKAEPMPSIVACAITHLPNLKGYHQDRLEIVQTCLTTMRSHAGREIPIYVWDNGSGPELRRWLLDEYKPEYLTLSPNIGKASARSSIVRSMPPKTIVCISDDDMYFYPDWLAPQLELLEKFPNVGVVSGYPVRTQFRWGNKSTLKWAQDNARLIAGRFIPDEWDRDFCTSIGRNYDWHKNYTATDRDYLIEYEGMRAYATAHHCQFIAYAGRIDYIVQWDSEALSDERKFDRAIDDDMLLRLTTTERLVRHIGNVLEPEFV
jgi:hypothetical protein